MERFVDGRYSAKLRLGMMIAYADASYTFEGKMRAPIVASTQAVTLGRPAVSQVGVEPPTSHHQRSWAYGDGSAPGPIELVHVWLPKA